MRTKEERNTKKAKKMKTKTRKLKWNYFFLRVGNIASLFVHSIFFLLFAFFYPENVKMIENIANTSSHVARSQPSDSN